MNDKFNWVGIAHLGVVYIVWGSTYLAIRVAVQPGAGFPPFLMGASRVLIAAFLLFLWGKITKSKLRLPVRETALLAASGLLLWTGGNGLVLWAEQHIDSGFTALILGSVPIFVAVIEALLDRKTPSLLLICSLLLGLLGLGVLTMPVLQKGVKADLYAVAALFAATISWAMGSLVQRRRPVNTAAPVSSAYQHLAGGLGFLLLAIIFHEPLPAPVPAAWIAWVYLVIFGSLLAFTSYITALRLLPTSMVMTYAYVNPVIAVFLGHLILKEPITPWTIGGAALILLGIVGVYRLNFTGKRLPGKVQ